MLCTRTSIDEELHGKRLFEKNFTEVRELLKDKFFLQHYFKPTSLNTAYWMQWTNLNSFNKELFSNAIGILDELKNLPRVRIAENEIVSTWNQLQRRQQ